MRIIDFDLYRDILKEKSGLLLTPDKSYLLDSRLSPVAKKWGYGSLESMTIALQGVPDKTLLTDIVEAMTTNDTSFFRDHTPFQVLRGTALKYLMEKRATKRQLKIWCAASSSGQEPYSIAMTLREMEKKISNWKIDIFATDISNEVLDQAREGIYSQFEVQRGLPTSLLVKYFTQIDEKWQIKPEIRKMVRFQPFNLLDSMSALGQFDIILCRNVLIYFDDKLRTQVVDRMAKQLDQDGFFFTGVQESLAGVTTALEAVPGQDGLYAKQGSPHLKAKATQAIA